MGETIDRLLIPFALVMLLSATGCQSWHTSAVLPGLIATKGERQVVKQARNDPFPSPRDVGMTNDE